MVDIVEGLRDASRVREGLEAVVGQVTNRDRVMMMLGPFMFSVGTAAPRQISRTARYSWPSQDRVGRRPLLQWTGRGAERIEIEGTIYPEFKGGLRQVQAMRELAGQGKRWLLVDGLGVVYGLFAILQVEETGSIYDKHGAPRRISFRLQLEYAGESEE
ncbi:phage tail protein [Arhodomonas aquaeolei]|uniref:phage tail protein n=1 Tax=Arhodomonas aquaeolei TaxID=2369 RepID=UPI0021691E3E|nr:phage tail protein [Arhodomonas aquaeolei]MCS4503902.1 phage tail protein [Arhodomonas aquaeolei]